MPLPGLSWLRKCHTTVDSNLYPLVFLHGILSAPFPALEASRTEERASDDRLLRRSCSSPSPTDRHYFDMTSQQQPGGKRVEEG